MTDTTQRKAIIFDMDGTLVDVNQIAHLLTRENEEEKEYNLYHALSVECPPVEWVAEAARKAADDGYAILVVTARRMAYVNQTRRFLYKNNIPVDVIFLRENDDVSSDYDLKKELLKRIRKFGYVVERAYEDNPEIIKLWVEEGIATVRVTGGGFH